MLALDNETRLVDLASIDALAPEGVLLSSELGEDDLVRLACGEFAGEEAVHGLERDALGLGQEEPDEDDRAQHQAREEEVDAVAHGIEHLGSEAGNDEVPEPVVRSGESLCESTDVLVEHLGVVDPWGTIPRWRVEDGPQVEECHGADTTVAEGLRDVLRGVSYSDVAADVPHAERATDSSVHEQVAASELVNKDEEPEKCDDGLDDAENASCEKRGGGTDDTDRLEDGGRVIVDGIDTGGVLPEEERATEEEAPHCLLVTEDRLEWRREIEAHRNSLVLKGRFDSLNFLLHVDVILIQLAHPA